MTELYVSEHGAGETRSLIVLIHGSMDRSSAFARVQRHLQGLHVVRYDRRGSGRATALGPAATFSVQVDDLAVVLDGRPAVLVGHSSGGVVALGLAQRAPELVRAVVAYESPMAWAPWWPSDSAGGRALAVGTSAEDAAEGFMRRMIGDERWERLPPRTRAARRAEGPALIADLRQIRDAANPPDDPATISVPVVAAHGAESSAHHQQTARTLAAEVPGAELEVVVGARHGIHLTHPAALAGLARRALARADDATT